MAGLNSPIRPSYRTETVEELDGARTVYEYLAPRAEALEALLRELFERHWSEIVFGPCVDGAVYEIRLAEAPRSVTLLDGYLTVDVGNWHFHLCIGEHKGTPANPASPALARKRRVSKAAFFHRLGDRHVGGSWGFRMWNGADEQMLTVFFPNPYLDKQSHLRKEPDWNKLTLWNAFRLEYLSGAVEWKPEQAA
jgi:hypothetical protein